MLLRYIHDEAELHLSCFRLFSYKFPKMIMFYIAHITMKVLFCDHEVKNEIYTVLINNLICLVERYFDIVNLRTDR
jgi:hypothetical protein